MFPGVVLEELDAGHWVHYEAYVPVFLPWYAFLHSRDTGPRNSSEPSTDISGEKTPRIGFTAGYLGEKNTQNPDQTVLVDVA